MTKSKKILITGAEGFIGKSLIEYLKRSGQIQVFTHSRDTGDIVTGELKYEGIDHVFHLAAKTFVPDSWKNPVDFYSVNVIGTAKVLDFCKKSGCSLTLLSSYVYGHPEYLPISESHPRKPYNPYSHSKIMAEDLAEFYSSTFNVRVITVRPFNVYGPGQSNDFLIPAIIEQALSDNIDFIEVADLRPKRDYIYIDDLISALVITMDAPETTTINVGSGESHSVEEVIQAIISITGIPKKYRSKNLERPNEVMDVRADITRIRERFNWENSTTLMKGISSCIEHFRKRKYL